MKFIIILCVLGLERYFKLNTMLYRFSWFDNYVRQVEKFRERYLTKFTGMPELLCLILPLPIILLLLCWAIGGKGNGFLYFILSFLVLLYCLGPAGLYQEFKTTAGLAPAQIFLAANKLLFGALFWYVVLGPVGALLYRVITLTSERAVLADSELSHLNKEALLLQGIADWLPNRVVSLGYALIGHFAQCFPFWLDRVLTGTGKNEEILVQSAQLALDSHSAAKSTTAAPHSVETAAVAMPLGENQLALELVDRVIILFLVIIAIFNLGTWLY